MDPDRVPALTLRQAIELYIHLPRSPHTNRSYTHILGALSAAVGGDGRDMRLVHYEDLAGYLGYCAERGLKASTLHQIALVIRAFFNHAVRVGQIDASPAAGLKVRRPRRRKRNRAVPSDDLAKMVEAVRAHPRNYALLLFLIDTACRAGGAASLTLDTLDLDTQTALLIEKGQVEHRVFFGDETAGALQRWLDVRPNVPHRFVFTGKRRNPLTPMGISTMVESAARKAGASKLWRAHAIRHAVGHSYADMGIPITATQKKLGHASPRTTMEAYYPDGDERVETVSHRHPLAPLAPLDGAAESPPASPAVAVKPKIIHFEDYVRAMRRSEEWLDES